MDLVTAEILIGGDLRNTVFKNSTNPITVPEIEILKAVHGEDSVKVGKECGHVKRTAKAEKARLAERYGMKVVDHVYPGVNGNGIDTGTDPAPKKKTPKPKPKQESLI